MVIPSDLFNSLDDPETALRLIPTFTAGIISLIYARHAIRAVLKGFPVPFSQGRKRRVAGERGGRAWHQEPTVKKSLSSSQNQCEGVPYQTFISLPQYSVAILYNISNVIEDVTNNRIAGGWNRISRIPIVQNSHNRGEKRGKPVMLTILKDVEGNPYLVTKNQMQQINDSDLPGIIL